MKRIAGFFLPAALLLLLLPINTALADGFSTDLEGIDRAAQSVLMLSVYNDKNELIGTGSGFVAFDNRTLITNQHVMADAELIVALSDAGDEYMVTKVAVADKKKDIAILTFFSPTDLSPLPLYAGDTLLRAAPVVAIGYPLGLANTVSMGNISAFYDDGGFRTIQFTAPISHGSSGGALLNDDGEVIGVTEGGFEEGQNLNLAVDIGEAIRLWAECKDGPRLTFREYRAASVTPSPTPVPTPTPKPTKTPKPTPVPTPVPTAKLTPGPVRNLKAVWEERGITLRWDKDPGSVYYRVFRSNTPASRYTLVAVTFLTSYTDTAISHDGPYYYRIVSMGQTAKAGEPSGPQVSVDPPYALSDTLKAPTGLKAQASQGKVTLSWKAVSGAKSYTVYRAEAAKGPFTLCGTAGGGKFTDTQALAGKTYYYMVRSISGNKMSNSSATVTAKVPKGS